MRTRLMRHWPKSGGAVTDGCQRRSGAVEPERARAARRTFREAKSHSPPALPMKNKTMTTRLLLAPFAFFIQVSAHLPLAMAETIPEKAALCTGCHGPQGHSQVPENPILAAQHPGYLESALQAYVSGERDHGIMRTLASRLSAEDIKALSAYFAAQPPAQTQARAAGDAARGQTRTAICATCHGPDGNSTIPANPNLAGQHATYLGNALMAYKSAVRSHPVMTSMVAALNEQDIEDIAAYYAAQTARSPSARTGEPLDTRSKAEGLAQVTQTSAPGTVTATPGSLTVLTRVREGESL